jgi:hypothetical protein
MGRGGSSGGPVEVIGCLSLVLFLLNGVQVSKTTAHEHGHFALKRVLGFIADL